MVLLADRANIGDLRHLVVENSRADEGGNEGGDHLAVEGDPRRNVGVMSEFKILGEVEGVRGCDVSVALEVEHSNGVTREPEATEQLGDDVEGDLYIGNCHDDTAGNAKDHGEEHAIQRSGGRGVGWVSSDSVGTETDRSTQDNEVCPLRNLFVDPHQTGVNVLGVGEGRFTSDHVLAAGNDLAAMVQNGMSDSGGIYRKGDAIHETVTSTQTGNTTSTKPDRELEEVTY